MNIAFDGRVLKHKSFTGIENYAKYIFKELKKEVRIELLKPMSPNKYMQHLWEHIKLPFLASKHDILFSPANLAPFFISKKTKLVLTIHDIAFITYPKSVSKFFYWYYSTLMPININRANQIITISEASKKEIIRVYPDAKDKITVIALGLQQKYRPLEEVKKEKQILYVGSINERKNIIGVIEAFEMLINKLEYNLVIVGGFFEIFSLSEKLKITLERAKKNKRIIFKQNLDDEALIYEYNKSCCFIFPSFYEGFGLPPLEAMACGTPVIVSNISSMPEVCGDSALYINPYDINDIANKIELLLMDTDLQNKLQMKGLQHAKSFTWEETSQKHIKVFEKVLK